MFILLERKRGKDILALLWLEGGRRCVSDFGERVFAPFGRGDFGSRRA